MLAMKSMHEYDCKTSENREDYAQLKAMYYVCTFLKDLGLFYVHLKNQGGWSTPLGTQL